MQNSGKTRRLAPGVVSSAWLSRWQRICWGSLVFCSQNCHLSPFCVYLAHYHPESILDSEVHSWFFTFCGFGQRYSDLYPPLQGTLDAARTWRGQVPQGTRMWRLCFNTSLPCTVPSLGTLAGGWEAASPVWCSPRNFVYSAVNHVSPAFPPR